MIRPLVNAFSIDLEDWFHILDVDVVRRDAWERYPTRVRIGTTKLLDHLARRGVSATFFVLGWMADRYPDLVRELVAAGHEVASHGYGHHLVYEQTRQEFAADLARSLDVLGALTGRPISGYRAPGFSVDHRSPWFWDELHNHGIEYDSSLVPALRNHGGMLNAARVPSMMSAGAGTVIEFPISTIGWGACRVTLSGGGYLRALPRQLVHAGIARLNARGIPAIVYLHPRDLDPAQPRLPLGLYRSALCYWGLQTTDRKVGELLDAFPFGTVTASLASIDAFDTAGVGSQTAS
jgi:polysaccharide deacetylase family protein (PEP-CTERM system associated)